MAAIAREVGAYFMVDMAHIAGLVAAGAHPEPRAATPTSSPPPATRPCAARAAASSSRTTRSIAKKIDKAVFPGAQGGPLMHVIAGKAVAFGEAHAARLQGVHRARGGERRARWARA